MADLHNVEGMLPVSLRAWSTHLLFGRPGRRFQSRPGRRPSDRSTWARRALWAGTSSLSLAIWPKIAMRRLAICLPTDARTVCDETVALLMWSIQRIPEICRWHLLWKASKVLRSAASNVHVSAAYRRTDMPSAWQRRTFVAVVKRLSNCLSRCGTLTTWHDWWGKSDATFDVGAALAGGWLQAAQVNKTVHRSRHLDGVPCSPWRS